jgi:hypothetical protein
MTILESYTFDAMVGDPDDHRPATRWAVLTDQPGGVEHLAAIVEEIAPGDGSRSTRTRSTRWSCIDPEVRP